MPLRRLERWVARVTDGPAPPDELAAARADFVSLVLHDVRSPLAAVVGGARTLQQRWPELSDEQRDTFLALIVDEANRLSILVSDVFDASSIDAGSFRYTFADVDVNALVRDAVATAAAGQDEIVVVAQLPEGSPAVRGDAARLRQVLANLIDNAVKYSPKDGTVEVAVSLRDGQVLIEVTDHGSGVAREDQALIFEKFGRVSSTDVKPGTGLGLYIGRSIAEAHGGSLAVSSSPGHGARFTLALPAAA